MILGRSLAARLVAQQCPWLNGLAVQLAALARTQHTTAIKEAFASCQEIVRLRDHENFLWARSLDVPVRAPVMMLRALNVETSLIGDQITQGGPPLKEMRFQWWKDSIDHVYQGQTVEHPVMVALKYSQEITPLSKYRLKRLVDAKAADQVSHKPFPMLQDLENFAESTQSGLLYLHLEAAGVRNSDADHAASHLGKAVGLASLLRGTLHFLSRGISYFPLDECARNGVSMEALYRGQGLDSDGVREVVFKIATAANGHLQACFDLHGRPEAVPVEARRLFMSSVACKLFLQALERCHFNLADPRMARGGFSPLWHIMNLKYVQASL
jgi:NADH dehydrogenase [ubiquinone] 1 alpha subcomplex assembly factor 6